VSRIFSTSTQRERHWSDGPDDVVHLESEEDFYSIKGRTLFDSVYSIDEKAHSIDTSSIGIASLTLRDISEVYGFSLAYLGDYLMQIGLRPPIEVDIKLGDMLTGEQLYTVLEAVNTLDPSDANMDYDSIFVIELAEELGIPIKRIMDICEEQGFHMPFGKRSLLHQAAVDRIIEIVSLQDSQEDDEEDGRREDNSISIGDILSY
jgi:hypothetical protein